MAAAESATQLAEAAAEEKRLPAVVAVRRFLEESACGRGGRGACCRRRRRRRRSSRRRRRARRSIPTPRDAYTPCPGLWRGENSCVRKGRGTCIGFWNNTSRAYSLTSHNSIAELKGLEDSKQKVRGSFFKGIAKGTGKN